MVIKPGYPAVDFEVHDIFGERITLRGYRGKRLLLSFYRYAACPLCNHRMESLVLMYPRFKRLGLNILAFFQSPRHSILHYVGKQDAPFPIVGDPERAVYRAYGVEPSLTGALKGMLRMPTLIRAILRGFKPGRIEGHAAMIPADFLIGPDLIVQEAYYGKDIGDHMSLNTIERWLRENRKTP